ncbi:zinc finger protein 287 isoform X1 [Hydra vulgaris]|uniref:zinc finger protein 287 isoform X1 n=1 Tax=Hydra vulgaris TaxID=6087 RepID=UPI001F5EF96F|nr:zinc finger protein 287-like [Hydra vulgaris]
MYKNEEYNNKKSEQYSALSKYSQNRKSSEFNKKQIITETTSDNYQNFQICDDGYKEKINETFVYKTLAPDKQQPKRLIGEPVSVIESTKIYEERSEETLEPLSECETVLLNLLDLFSSTATLSDLRFSEIIFPTLTDDVTEVGNNFESPSTGSDEKNSDHNAPYLPGSMFSRKTMNASQVESYLNENDLKENPSVFWKELNHQSWWGRINPLLGENLLPPAVLSSYDELNNMHHNFQSSNSTEQQYGMPIYFHPYVIPSQKDRYNQNVNNTIKKNNYNHKTPLPSYWRNSCNEEHLNKYEARTESNIKHLEDAAEILLHVSQRGRKKKQLFSPSKEKYKCTVCGQCFARQYTLDTHERIHTGAKPFKCPHCDICFRQSGTRRNHVRAVHAKERPFVCEYCGKTFAHKSSITVHIRIHTNEKPHQCQTCKRTFTDRATCSKHQTTHSGAKPYRCKVCSKCFSQKSNLKRHFQNIHVNRDS